MTEENSLSDWPAFLETEHLTLRGLELSDAGSHYHRWLNDPDVLRFRGPKGFPSRYDSIENYVKGIAERGDLVLAIIEREMGQHIGNISLNSILWIHRSAELSIMIGEKSTWGKGYGREAIRAVSQHAFRSLGLLRVWAESPNPGFNKAVEALGWTKEGVKRKAFQLDGEFTDIICWSLLADEFDPDR